VNRLSLFLGIAFLLAINLYLPICYCEEADIRVEEKIVRGKSLSPLIEHNDKVRVLFNCYKENEIKRGDIVACNFSGNEALLIKIVKAVPGDTFHISKNENKYWHLFINNKICRNSEDKPYLIDEQGAKMILLYEKGCNGVIPQNAYLILGNLVYGSRDSTRFGLVSRDDIIAKVELVNVPGTFTAKK
jgi:signal peptidase I